MATFNHRAIFNRRTIIEMFRLSELIYYIHSVDVHVPTPGLEEHSIRYGYSSDNIITFVSNDNTNVKYCISTNSVQKRTCIAIRGTNRFTDWMNNIQYKQSIVKNNICVHSGYLKLLFTDNLYHHIYDQINTLLRQYPENEIFITGHSAGGALATLLGYFLSKDLTGKQINVVSFASPRIGNYAFKMDFMSRTNLVHNRVINKYDIVHLVPFFGYYNVGHKIVLKTSKFRCYYCCCFDSACAHTRESHFTSLMDVTTQ